MLSFSFEIKIHNNPSYLIIIHFLERTSIVLQNVHILQESRCQVFLMLLQVTKVNPNQFCNPTPNYLPQFIPYPLSLPTLSHPSLQFTPSPRKTLSQPPTQV